MDKNREAELLDTIDALQQQVTELEARVTACQKTEAELRQAEERQRLISALTSDYAYVLRVTPQGKLKPEWTSEAFSRLTGYRPDELSFDQLLASLVPSADQPLILQQIHNLLQGQPDVTEMRIITKNGRQHWVRSYARPIWDKEEERITHIYGAAQDITAQKQAEAEAHRTETQLLTFLQNSTEDILVIDPNYKILFVNRVWPGLTMEQVVGASCLEFLEPEPAQRLQKALDTVFATGQPAECEIYANHRWFTDRLIPIAEEGRVTAALLIASDITERKQAAAALEQSQAHFQAVWENASDAMVLSDPEGVVLEANPAYHELYGFSPAEVIGHDFTIIFPPDQRQAAHEIYQAAFTSLADRLPDYKSTVQRADGRIRTVETRASFISQNGRRVALLSIIRDVTEREQLQAALRHSQQFGQTVLNSLPAHIAVIDQAGQITAVNEAWRRFARQNGVTDPDAVGSGQNYLEICNQTRGPDQPEAQDCLASLRAVLNGALQWAELEYPCHSPTEKRWFLMRITPLTGPEGGAVVLHFNITKRKQAELARRRSEERFRIALEGSFDAFYFLETVKDEQGQVIDFTFAEMNGQAEKELGMSCEQLTGRRICEVFPVNRENGFFEQYKQVFETGFPMEQEYQIPAEYAAPGWYYHQVIPLASGVAIVNRDITARKQTEARLRFQAQLLDGVRESVIATDLDGRVTYWGKGAEALYGYSAAEVMGQVITFFVVESQDQEAEANRIQETLETGLWRGQYQQRRKDGSLFWADTVLSLVRDEQGQPAGIIGIDRDITKQKEAQDTLHHYAQRLQILHDIAQAILAAGSPEEIATAALERTRELIPYQWATISVFDFETEQATLLITLNQDQKPPDSHPLAELGDLLAALKQGQPRYLAHLSRQTDLPPALRRLQKNGVEAIICAPLLYQHKLLGCLSLQTDQPAAFTAEQTEFAREMASSLAIGLQNNWLYQQIQQQAQTLEQRVAERTAQLSAANKELEAFSYSVSHDLRAPLRHIDGFIQRFINHQTQPLDETSERYLEIVTQTVERMGQMIDGLLSFSRMGRMEMNIRQLDLNAMIQELQQELQALSGYDQIAWRIEPLPPVEADPVLLRMVWRNLLENAIKYSATGSTQSHIEIGVAPPEKMEAGEIGLKNNYVILYVKDNGIGFDSAYAHKLFGMFQRLHRAEEFEGTGVGLATVRRILHKHDQEIWAEGQPKQGATFYFTLPLTKEGL